MRKCIAVFILAISMLICLTGCHSHKFREWSVTKNATCTEDGVKTRYCDCGEKQNDAIPATGHKYVNGVCNTCGNVSNLPESDSNSLGGNNDSNSNGDNASNNIFEHEGTEGLDFYPLADGTYGVKVGKAQMLEEIVIPAEYNGKMVTAVLENAFEGCPDLKTIKLSSNVQSIGDSAFKGCTSLISIEFPDSVATIGNQAFSRCTSLKKVSFSLNSKLSTLGHSAFYFCDSLETVTFAIKSPLKYIDDSTFYQCSAISTITLPSGLKSIGAYAFYCCEELVHINIPSSVEVIDSSAFYLCKSLKTVIFDDNSRLNSIGSYAFHGCIVLEKINIPQNVTSIGYEAFSICYVLGKISFAGTVKQWNDISMGYSWNRNVPAIEVVCSDGTVPLK